MQRLAEIRTRIYAAEAELHLGDLADLVGLHVGPELDTPRATSLLHCGDVVLEDVEIDGPRRYPVLLKELAQDDDSGGSGVPTVPSSLVAGTQHWVLLAIPTFVFAGNLMERCGMSYALVTLARVLVGWVRGGLAMVAVVAMPASTSASRLAVWLLSFIDSRCFS